MKDFLVASRSEIKLILNCSRPKLEVELIEHITALLKGEIDWQYVIRYVNDHGITQLLYQSLKQINSSDVPSSVLAYLRHFCRNNSLRNFRLMHELILILDLFSFHGISAVAFKGPVLSMLAYQNIALRQFGDLDILVREHEFSQAQAILISNGYHLSTLTNNQKKDLDFHSGEISFVKDNGHTVIDLHWKIAPRFIPFQVDLNIWWVRLQPINLNGSNALTFSLEDTLLHLCIHASSHLWTRLEWLCDIAALIRSHHSQIDWAKVLKQANKVGCDRILLLNCLLIRNLLGSQLPNIISDRISLDPTLNSLFKDIQSFIFPQPHESEPFGRKEGLFVFIKMRECPWHQFIHLFYIMNRSGWATPTIRDTELFKLPLFLSFLYWFIRPFRLFQKYKMILHKLFIK